MPIYEYYCPDNNTIYQFFAKTLAQGQTTPPCPDNPVWPMERIMSAFAVTNGTKKTATETAGEPTGQGPGEADDPRLDAAMQAMEKEFSNVDENDPRAMGRMMRRMAELTGEKMDGEMEEVVRKLEEGTDPEKLEEQLGGNDEGSEGGEDYMGEKPPAPDGAEKKEPRARYKIRRQAPRRDPQLYDYPQS